MDFLNINKDLSPFNSAGNVFNSLEPFKWNGSRPALVRTFGSTRSMLLPRVSF